MIRGIRYTKMSCRGLDLDEVRAFCRQHHLKIEGVGSFGEVVFLECDKHTQTLFKLTYGGAQ